MQREGIGSLSEVGGEGGEGKKDIAPVAYPGGTGLK